MRKETEIKILIYLQSHSKTKIELKMKKLLLLLLVTPIFLTAQEDEKQDGTWEHDLITSFNISQISFVDWSQGGENSLSWVITGDLVSKYTSEKWAFKNELKADFGRTKLGEDEFKTNVNDLFLETVLAMKLGWAVDPYASNTFRTQLTAGYDYKVVPVQKIADFWDPAYITQSLGFTYDKLEVVKTRLGIAIQETVTDLFPNYSDDPDTPELEDFKLETGIENVTDILWNFAENMQYKSKIRLFSAFNRLDTWDVRFDNILQAKVNNYVNVNLAVLVIYQVDQSPYTQVKEALQLGFTYSIF